MTYQYLTWAAGLFALWLVAYLARPDLRRKMLWSGLIAMPFGVGELYFIPNYWTPQTLFDWGMRYHLDIEAFLLMFALGGLAGFVYEGVLKKAVPCEQRFCGAACRCYLSLVATLTVFIVLVRAAPGWNIIYPSILACLAGGLAAAITYPQLIRHVLLGGALFAALYWISLALIGIPFPGWIASTWDMAALSGITLTRVPLEEILFGFAFGTLWTPLYEEVCSNIGMRHLGVKRR